MDLQQKQLDDLDSWLNKMEEHIKNQDAVGTDLDTIHAQVNEHKVGQGHEWLPGM